MDSSVAVLLEYEPVFQDPGGMLHLGLDVGFLRMHHIKKPALSRLSSSPAQGSFHGNPELGVRVLELFPLLGAESIAYITQWVITFQQVPEVGDRRSPGGPDVSLTQVSTAALWQERLPGGAGARDRSLARGVESTAPTLLRAFALLVQRE